jgi:hypothetical protein
MFSLMWTRLVHAMQRGGPHPQVGHYTALDNSKVHDALEKFVVTVNNF